MSSVRIWFSKRTSSKLSFIKPVCQKNFSDNPIAKVIKVNIFLYLINSRVFCRGKSELRF